MGKLDPGETGNPVAGELEEVTHRQGDPGHDGNVIVVKREVRGRGGNLLTITDQLLDGRGPEKIRPYHGDAIGPDRAGVHGQLLRITEAGSACMYDDPESAPSALYPALGDLPAFLQREGRKLTRCPAGENPGEPGGGSSFNEAVNHLEMEAPIGMEGRIGSRDESGEFFHR